MFKESRVNWLANLSRPKLDKYIQQCQKLLREAEIDKNEHNVKIYSLWLSDAIFESNKRYHNKSLYLERLKKSSHF